MLPYEKGLSASAILLSLAVVDIHLALGTSRATFKAFNPMSKASYLIQGPIEKKAILFAHGAGAGMQHPWMQLMSDYLETAGVGTIRFDFPYMLKSNKTKIKYPPDRSPILLDNFAGHWDFWSERLPLLTIGGKSMGGRMALNLALDYPVGGVVVFSYPLISSSKIKSNNSPTPDRLKPLQAVAIPALIIQGDNDPMGNHQNFPSRLSHDVSIIWCQHANHDLMAPRKSAVNNHLQWQLFTQMISQWIE